MRAAALVLALLLTSCGAGDGCVTVQAPHGLSMRTEKRPGTIELATGEPTEYGLVLGLDGVRVQNGTSAAIAPSFGLDFRRTPDAAQATYLLRIVAGEKTIPPGEARSYTLAFDSVAWDGPTAPAAPTIALLVTVGDRTTEVPVPGERQWCPPTR